MTAHFRCWRSISAAQNSYILVFHADSSVKRVHSYGFLNRIIQHVVFVRVFFGPNRVLICRRNCDSDSDRKSLTWMVYKALLPLISPLHSIHSIGT